MNKLVELDAVIDEIEKWYELYPDSETAREALSLLKRSVKKLPTIDGKEEARWEWDDDGMDWGIGAWLCSSCKSRSPVWWNCDKSSPYHKEGHRFCPNCGAKMVKP